MSDHDSRRARSGGTTARSKSRTQLQARCGTTETAAAKEQQRNLRSLSERYGFRLTHPSRAGTRRGGSGRRRFRHVDVRRGRAGMAKTAGFLGVKGWRWPASRKPSKSRSTMKIRRALRLGDGQGAHQGSQRAQPGRDGFEISSAAARRPPSSSTRPSTSPSSRRRATCKYRP